MGSDLERHGWDWKLKSPDHLGVGAWSPASKASPVGWVQFSSSVFFMEAGPEQARGHHRIPAFRLESDAALIHRRCSVSLYQQPVYLDSAFLLAWELGRE